MGNQAVASALHSEGFFIAFCNFSAIHSSCPGGAIFKKINLIYRKCGDRIKGVVMQKKSIQKAMLFWGAVVGVVGCGQTAPHDARPTLPDLPALAVGADTQWDQHLNVHAGVSDAWGSYRASGISGVKTDVQRCFQAADGMPDTGRWTAKLLEYCVALDATGQLIDELVTESLHLPGDDYFAHPQAKVRALRLARWRRASNLKWEPEQLWVAYRENAKLHLTLVTDREPMSSDPPAQGR
jgi:hypothetical protein